MPRLTVSPFNLAQSRSISLNLAHRYSSRLQSDGERLLPNVYKAMNSWGGVGVSVFTETTSYNDPTLVRAHDAERKCREQFGHEDIQYTVVDNPHKDGPGLRANLFAGNGKEQFVFTGSIEVIVEQAHCDRACSELSQYSVLYWDTESVAFLDGSGTNTNTASLVQICGDDSKVYLFRVGQWPRCWPTFTALMGKADVPKVAHFASHDVADLHRRFPSLQVRGSKDLCTYLTSLDLGTRALDGMILKMFNKWLDKRVDHRLWHCNRLLERHQRYAATDAFAVFALVQAAQSGQRPVDAQAAAAASDDSSSESEDAQPQRAAGRRVAVTRRHATRSTTRAAVGHSESESEGENDGEGEDDSSSDDESDSDSDSDGDSALDEDVQGRLLKQSKLQIADYAKSKDETDLYLSSALNNDQRKELHRYCDRFELQGMSIGEGTSRRLVVSRFKQFVAVTAADAQAVVGACVLKDPTGGRGAKKRGYVAKYDANAARWLLKYGDGEQERVDLDLLNVRLRRRAVADHGPGGIDGAGVPTVGEGSDGERAALLTKLEDGIVPGWATNFPKYDARHWSGNLTAVLAVEKGSPIFNLFMSLASDALFWMLPGEDDRVRKHCEALGMQPEQINQLRRKYWRRRARYACPAPRLILRALVDLYLFFKGMRDPLKPSSYVYVPNAEKIFLKECAYVQQGLLSDPPGMNMYRIVGQCKRTKLIKFRSLRTSSALEGSFLHYSRSLHPTAKAAGPRTLHVSAPDRPVTAMCNRHV